MAAVANMNTQVVFPPTLVKEDGALPETADCRMDLTVVLRWGRHDEPVVFCNPVLRSVNRCCLLGTFRLQTANQPISLEIICSESLRKLAERV